MNFQPVSSNIKGKVFWGPYSCFLICIFLVQSKRCYHVAAVFISDPVINTAGEALPTANGKLHQLGALLDSIPFASVLISIGLLRKNELWKQAKKKLLWSTFFVWVGLIVFLVSMAVLFPANGKFGPDVLMGWPNRIMISVQCIWLVVVARQAIKINTAFNPSSAQTKSYKKVIAY